jgi:hypothetical protein
MFPIFFNTFGEDQNIINIHNSKMRKWVEDIIHDVLEFTRGILQTKRHNIPLIMSKWSGKSNFVPILILTRSFLLGIGYLIHSSTSLRGL